MRVFASLAFLIFSSVAFSQDNRSSWWFYGEGICAGGYTYDLYKTCEDRSLPPLREFSGPNLEVCGATGEFTQVSNTCRHPSFGPLESYQSGETKIVKNISMKRINQTLIPAYFQQQCEQYVQELYQNPLPLGDGIFEVPYIYGATNISEESLECQHRDIFRRCDSWYHLRSADCEVTTRKVRYPQGTDANICGSTNGEPIPKTCVWARIYPETSRPECGVESSMRSQPFGNLGLIGRLGGNLKCLTHDQMQDETAAQLAAKIEALLRNIELSLPTDTYTFLVRERSAAMLVHLLRSRSAEISQDHISRIFRMGATFRFLTPPEWEGFSENDVRVKVGEEVTVVTGGPGQTQNLREILVSLPKYSDAAAVCLADADTCAKKDADWIYFNLKQYLGNNYLYAGYLPTVPDVFTVKAMMGRNHIDKQITRGVNESTNLFTTPMLGGNFKVAFGKETGDSSRYLVVDPTQQTTGETLNIGGRLAPDGKHIVDIRNGKMRKFKATTGALVQQWSIADEYRDVIFRDNDPLVTTGTKLHSPQFNVTFSLQGAEDIYPTDLTVSATLVAAPVSKHKVTVWSYGTGAKLFSIEYEPEVSGPPVYDSVKIVAGRIFIKSYAEKKVRIYDEAGTLLKTVETEEYANLGFITPDGKKLLYANTKLNILNTETGLVQQTMTVEEGASYQPLDSNAAVSLVMMHVRRRIPGPPVNNPVSMPINTVESIEVWNPISGVRDATIEIPKNLNFLGFVNE